MTILPTTKTSFHAALLATAAVFAAPAYAQPQDETEDQPPIQAEADPSVPADDSDAILITGSRIQRRDLTATSPLAVVQDEEFRLSGAVNVEQVINTLPQVIPGITAFSNNPSTGTALLDLRGLGAERTLILVNSRRWMFYDPNQLVDVNTIPQFLIDSVDVVTGGASAVYGSDALAGVINFRLMTDLTGVLAGGQYSITEDGDGRRYNTYLAIGSDLADGRGFATAFVEYYNRGRIMQGDRDFSFFALGEGANGLTPGGSSTPPFGRFRDLLGTTGGVFDANGRVFDAPGGPSRPARPGLADFYNYAPANYLMIPQERWLVGGYGEFEISSNVTAFAEAAFVNNRVAIELAATPVTGLFDVDVTQACGFLVPAECARFQQAAVATGDPNIIEGMFVQRRTVEAGSRNQLDERNAFRALAGIKGPLTETLNYELYYFYARTRNSQVQEGNISSSAFAAGLDGSGPAINIFGPNTLTPAMVGQIDILTQNSDIAQLQVANAAISGNLFQFGSARDPVGFALGTEWRSVSARFIPDEALSSGDVIGFNAGEPTQGGYDVKEVFAELRIPIIQEGFVHRFEVTGAARYSDYSLEAVGGVWTYAAGAEFAPVPDITFRGQYQRAVRAPNVAELFAGAAINFPLATDPCARPEALTDPTIRQLCIATGVPNPATNPNSLLGQPGLQLNVQIESALSGSPTLEEEVADTWTVGAVIRPSFIPRLNITVDYYNITIENAIATRGGGANNILRLCYNVIQDVNSVFCQSVRRDPAGIISGGQFSILEPNENVSLLETSGVDLQVDYSQPLGFSMTGAGESRLNFFFLGTWVDEFNVTPTPILPDEVTECAGRFGVLCDRVYPKWKWTSRFSLIDGPATISLRWRHLGSVRDDDDGEDFFVERIGSYDLFDLSFAYDVSDELTINMGVNNLLDKDPPIMGDNQEQSNTWPSSYDVLGRDFFISANLRF